MLNLCQKFINDHIFKVMELNIDVLISFYKKGTFTDTNLDEQDDPAAASSSSSGGEKTTTGKPLKKWASGRTFGKTYMNDPKYKWESGRKFGPTYNPGQVWKSGRVMGKTGGSDFE